MDNITNIIKEKTLTGNIIDDLVILHEQVNALMSNTLVQIDEIPSNGLIDNASKIVVANNLVFGENVDNSETGTIKTTTITAKLCTLNNIQCGENNFTQKLNINADTILINGGNFNISKEQTNTNSQISLNNSTNIVIDGLSINSDNGFNAMEIGLNDSEAKIKNITIKNFNINTPLAHNPINIFSFADNAVINITDCTFASAWCLMRLSNKFNSKNLTINIKNCTIEKTSATQMSQYGLFCFEDYTSKNTNEVLANNQFGNDNVTINLTNVIYDGIKLTKEHVNTMNLLSQEQVMGFICGDKLVPPFPVRETCIDHNLLPTINILG